MNLRVLLVVTAFGFFVFSALVMLAIGDAIGRSANLPAFGVEDALTSLGGRPDGTLGFMSVDAPPEAEPACQIHEVVGQLYFSCSVPMPGHTHPKPPEKFNRPRHFGGWVDADSDGLDTRQEILMEESLSLVATTRDGTKVLSGEWLGPYTGKTYTNPGELHGEHLVSLKEAWEWGAWTWSKAKRAAFANYLADSDHLLAVYGRENQSKQDRGIADSDRGTGYMPPLSKCEYAVARVRVWAHPRWGLPYVPQSEKDATLEAIAVNCLPQY